MRIVFGVRRSQLYRAKGCLPYSDSDDLVSSNRGHRSSGSRLAHRTTTSDRKGQARTSFISRPRRKNQETKALLIAVWCSHFSFYLALFRREKRAALCSTQTIYFLKESQMGLSLDGQLDKNMTQKWSFLYVQRPRLTEQATEAGGYVLPANGQRCRRKKRDRERLEWNILSEAQ